MGKYIIRRILQSIPLLLIIAVLTFVLLKTVGDPLQYLADNPSMTDAERFRLHAVLGLNDPLPLQFVTWLVGDDWYFRDITGDGLGDVYGERHGVLRGDFGDSFRLHGTPATEVITEKLPNTLILG